jgi:predicted RNase H-like HicB family nuclease
VAQARRVESGLEMFSLTVNIREDTLDGGFNATVLELPGCVSQGATHDEAISNISDAIVAYLEVKHAGSRVEILGLDSREPRGGRDEHPVQVQLTPCPA